MGFKSALFILFAVFSVSASAESAFKKTISINALQSVNASGPLRLVVQQAPQAKLEFFANQAALERLEISQEGEALYIVLREQDGADHLLKADIYLSVPNLSTIRAEDLDLLELNEFKLDADLELEIAMGTRALLSAIHGGNLSIRASQSSEVETRNVEFSGIAITGLNSSKVTLEDAYANALTLNLSNSAAFTAGAINLVKLNVRARNSATAVFKEPGHAHDAFFKASNGSDIDARKILLQSAEIDVSNGAELTLSAAERVTGKASNGSDVGIYGDANIEVKKSAGASINKKSREANYE